MPSKKKRGGKGKSNNPAPPSTSASPAVPPNPQSSSSSSTSTPDPEAAAPASASPEPVPAPKAVPAPTRSTAPDVARSAAEPFQPSSLPRSGHNTPISVPIPNIPPRSAAASPALSSSATGRARSGSAAFKPSSLSAPHAPARRTSPMGIGASHAEGASLDKLDKSPAQIRSGESGLTAGLKAAGTSASATPSGTSPEVSRPSVDRASSSAALRSDLPTLGRSGDSTPVSPAIVARDTAGPVPGESSFSNLADVPNEEKARVLGKHLMSAKERRGSTSRTPRSGDASPAFEPKGGKGAGGESTMSRVSQGSLRSAARSGKGKDALEGAEEEGGGDGGEVEEESGEEGDYGAMGESFHIPYDAPGVDTTHDLYKWQQDHRPGPQRSASFSHVPLDRSTILDPTLAHIREPGGFRRNFVVNRAQEQGLEPPTLVRNVVDFLFLYGHFAGEDLDEDDDDLSDTDSDLDEYTPAQLEAGVGAALHEDGAEGAGADGLPGGAYGRAPFSFSKDTLRLGRSGERQPLLTRGSTMRSVSGSATRGPGTLSRGVSKSRHRRTKSGPPVGTASVTQAVLMLLKGFVGTGILFMGKAFFNGGLLFSTIVLLLLAGISLWAFLLLTKTYLVIPGSFGDIGGALYGNWVRVAILASIAVSQIGFVAAYTIFIAQNLQAFILAVTDCRTFIETRWLIFAQLLIFMPLAMIRNLAKLSGTALVADAFILIGIIYIVANESAVLAAKGLADVAMFNPHNFPLFIGTAVFTFEGIGLIIPITESMREPHKFPRALSGVMLGVSVLFAGAGAMGYMAYGSKIQTVVIVNLPQEDKFVQAVQFLYSIAILLSIPLQLFPAVRIMENGLFVRSGKHNPSVKWQKNIFRAAVVIGCSLLSWAGSKELDKFVSLIGSFACIPLCFIYPPMLHLKACARTRTAKALDIALLAFGIGICAFTTVQTIRSLAEPSGPPPVFGKCSVPDGFY